MYKIHDNDDVDDDNGDDDDLYHHNISDPTSRAHVAYEVLWVKKQETL